MCKFKKLSSFIRGLFGCLLLGIGITFMYVDYFIKCINKNK